MFTITFRKVVFAISVYRSSWAFCPFHYDARSTNVSSVLISQGILSHTEQKPYDPVSHSQQTAVHFSSQ